MGQPGDCPERLRHLGRMVAGIFFQSRQKPQWADRKRCFLNNFAVLNGRQLQAAAAQVGDHPPGAGKAGKNPVGRKLGLCCAGQNPDLETAGLFNPFNKRRTVFRIAHRGGRHRRDLVDIHIITQVGEPSERRQRHLHRLLIHAAGGGDAARQAAQHPLVENNVRAPLQPPVNHQADRVRANINNRNQSLFGRARHKSINPFLRPEPGRAPGPELFS